MSLEDIVISLIDEKSEGNYWDFKQYWHNNNADLLKDIICMANNTTIDMQDGYIIFGIEDKTFNITGVSDDSNRKNQENIIGFLSAQTWAGEEMPNVDVKTIVIDSRDIDVIIIRNSDVTPYYLLKDYSKSINNEKSKKIIHAGVIYSRNGDRNTSSAESATKQAVEFLWKKRFGLAGSDDFKVIKRLLNIDSWYSMDEFDTLYNSEHDDIRIVRDKDFNHKFKIADGDANTTTWVMDFPYLFSNILNWNIGKEETGRRAKWDIYLNSRMLDISLFGVQATRQTYYHIEPEIYWYNDLGICLNNITQTIMYYAYIRNSIRFLSFNLFLSKQCYKDEEGTYAKALAVIPVFESEQEHKQFLDYIKIQKKDFIDAVKSQNISEMFPPYSQMVNSAIVYKLGKTLVHWLDDWRDHNND